MHKKEQVTLTNLCMIYDQDRILVQDKVGQGIIFPGGHIEPEEPIVDSVIREIKEETGLTIHHPKLCGVKNWTDKNGYRYIVFMCELHPLIEVGASYFNHHCLLCKSYAMSISVSVRIVPTLPSYVSRLDRSQVLFYQCFWPH